MIQDARLESGKTKADSCKGFAAVALLRSVIYLVLAGTVGVAAFSGYETLTTRAALSKAQASVVSGMGLVEPTSKHLAPGYSDRYDRLLADAPTNSADQLDPATLVVAYEEDADVENQQVDWKTLCTDIEKSTGKKVVSRPYQNTVEDVSSVKAGAVQIVALRAADTPYLVNTAGFIPIGVLGGKAGPTGNKLDISVPASSSIHSLSDLKGHSLTCTIPSSITGYRAAVAILMSEANLRPNVDYLINFSLGQKKSIKGLAKSEFEAAALSDDKVQSMLADGKIQSTEYRTIFQSEVIPRLTIGYIYNLKPDLAAQIKQSILNFDNENRPGDEHNAETKRFAPVDYKKDFALVRRIDDAFDPRFNASAAAKAKIAAPAVPTTGPSVG